MNYILLNILIRLYHLIINKMVKIGRELKYSLISIPNRCRRAPLPADRNA